MKLDQIFYFLPVWRMWMRQRYPHLPEIGWTKNWDMGLRLRLAVAYTYITNLYDPGSFGRLDLDWRTRALLGDAADRFKGGGKYEKATRQG